MKVLIISPLFPPQGSGAEVSTMLYCKGLVENDVNVILITNNLITMNTNQKWMRKLKTYKIPMPFVSFTYPSTKPFGEVLYWVLQKRSWDLIKKIVLKEDVDIIDIQHAFTGFERIRRKPIIMTIRDYWPICIYRTTFAGNKSCVRCTFKEIISCRRKNYMTTGMVGFPRMLYGSLSSFLIYSLSRKLYRDFKNKLMQVDRIIAISNFQRELLKLNLGLKNEMIEVIYPLLPDMGYIPRKASSNDNSITFTYIGSLVVSKGILNLLKAFTLAVKRNPNIKLIICGSGILQSYINRYISSISSLQRNIFLMGYIKQRDLYKVYEITDVVVVPSLWPEAFGRAALEALTVGRPVLINPVGGLKEQTIEGLNSFYADCFDIGKLSEKLLEISEYPRDKLIKMGFKAREYMLKKFSQRRIIKQVINLYESLI